MATLPSLNGLRAFEAAARHLSFTRAAAELNVTQTAISHQIRRLEEQLGMRLFERRNRGLALTREAEGYLPVGARRVRGPAPGHRAAATARPRRTADGQHHGVAGGEMAGDADGGVPGRASGHRGAHHHLRASGRFPARASRHGGALRPRQLAGPARALADGRGHLPGVQPGVAARGKAAAPAGGSGASHPAARHGVARGLAALADRGRLAGLARDAARAEFRSEFHGDSGGDGRARRGARAHTATSKRTSPRAGWSCHSTWCCRPMPGSTSLRRRKPPTRRRSRCFATG